MLVALYSAAALGASSDWSVSTGMNACNTPTKGGPCGGVAKDHPGFHYVGVLNSTDACSATCEATGTNCTIWLYSTSSKHCWWRLDGVWDPNPNPGVTSGCRSTPAAGIPCVAGCSGCPISPTPAPKPRPPFVPTTRPNMNGDYILSPTPKGQDVQSKFPTNFKDYPRGVESFDVYSPTVRSYYSQVFWKGLPPVDLPKDIVERYAGVGMAVVGFEMDQVRIGAGPNGEDVSVPINVAYNHHFESNMVGGNARFEKQYFTGAEDPKYKAVLAKKMASGMGGHGLPSTTEHWAIVGDEIDAVNGLPTSTSFGGANGGEYRKSFHGYSPGFVQVISGPKQFAITPMQIDTWNRDEMNLTGPTKFVAGPLPRNSLAAKDAQYSGLLECPLTTRVEKVIDVGYTARTNGTCDATKVITSAILCFSAARNFLGRDNHFEQLSGSDASQPMGCSIGFDATSGATRAYYNDGTAGAACGKGATVLQGSTSSLVDIGVTIDAAKDLVTITLTGPAAVWFGVGFNAQVMKDGPWAIIVEAPSTATGAPVVSERKLADQNSGVALASSIKVVSTSVKNGRRTIVATRAMKGQTANHYSFTAVGATKIGMINAVGSGAKLAYHQSKEPTSLSILPVVSSSAIAGACVCNGEVVPFGSAKGSLHYHPNTTQAGENGTEGSVGFGNNCAPEPRTDLLNQSNPTCDVRTYVGGQTACHHMWSLLDADQEIPWVDQPLEYSMKFRFYVQPYNASYHTNLFHNTWGIASPVEYDVPKCEEGMTGCSRAEDGSWIHTIKGTYKGKGHLSAAHFHCHAPTCLKIAMYRNDTGELLCEERPVYGGTGKIDNPDMDEPGFILQPPCMWGDAEFGLESPPDVDGVWLHTVKTANATSGHHGEMAWQQMYLF